MGAHPRPELRITPVVQGDAVWLHLEGELDRSTVPELNSAFSAAERQQPETVGLEASRVAFVDAGGLHALVSAARRARTSGRRFVIANPAAPLRRLLSRTLLDRAIEVISGGSVNSTA